MASTVKHLRSSTANKRPTASGLADGQLGINTASGTPGVFFKDSAGTVVKVGPAHVGSSAPNVSPAGSAGNSRGELWVNNSATIHGLNYYTGSAFVNLTPSGTTTVAGLVELATNAETQTGTDTVRAVTPSGLQSKISDSTSTTSSTTIASATAVKAAYDLADAALPKSGGRVTGALEIGPAGSLVFEGSSDNSFETTLAVVDPTADRTITFPNVTGNVVTTGDSGTVTSTMIANGTIVDADISASAAIALSKLGSGVLPSGVTVASANITDGTIVNADINASAAIADTKLATISTAGKVNGSAITSGDIATSGDLKITNLAPNLRLTESDGTATHSQTALIRSNDQFLLQTRDSAGAIVSSDYLVPANASGATDHIWRIANTERARIDSSGRLLVGSPSSYGVDVGAVGTEPAFQNHGTSYSTSAAGLYHWQNSATNAPFFSISKSRGALGTHTVLVSGDRIGGLSFNGSDGTNFKTAAAIEAEVDGTPGANDMPGRLVFSTTADGGSSLTERMRIDSSGRVGIGTTSPDAPLHVAGLTRLNSNDTPTTTTTGAITRSSAGVNTGNVGLECTATTSATRHHISFVNPNGVVGSISTNGSATAYNTSSDYRLKENVVPLTGALDRLRQLPVHRFNFIADPDKTVDGFIAHEAAAVVPECVTGEKDQIDENGKPIYQGIDQSKIVPLLTAALQEAIAKIEALEARIVALEA